VLALQRGRLAPTHYALLETLNRITDLYVSVNKSWHQVCAVYSCIACKGKPSTRLTYMIQAINDAMEALMHMQQGAVQSQHVEGLQHLRIGKLMRDVANLIGARHHLSVTVDILHGTHGSTHKLVEEATAMLRCTLLEIDVSTGSTT
jgi:hypothetical protein